MKNGIFLGMLASIAMSVTKPLCAEVVSQPVINVLMMPQDDGEVDTQAIYGTCITVVENPGNGWSKIRMADQAEGWVKTSQITQNDPFEQSQCLRPLRNLFAHIYRAADTAVAPPLLTLPFGARVLLVNAVDNGERWVPIELVTGEKAWIQRGDIDFTPRVKTMREMLVFCKKFIGLPYTWGGTSAYGYDCSGYVQMLFKEMGVLLPRNSRDQAQSSLLMPIAKEDLQPGDLVFFGESRITHVGLYLGNDEVIYSGVRGETPTIMIDHLKTTKYVFNAARRLCDPKFSS